MAGADTENPRIRIVLPVALKEVFEALSPDFSAATGYRFDVDLMLNPEVPDHVLSGADWSIALSNPPYIQQIVDAGRCEGGVQILGYSPLCFAVRSSGETTPLSGMGEISDLLKQARTIALTDGGTSTAQFARMAAKLGLSQALDGKLHTMPGGGPAKAALDGRVEVAVLPLSNVAPVPGLVARAVCPREMDVQVDLALCLSDRANAATWEFASWLLDPGRRDALQKLGVTTGAA